MGLGQEWGQTAQPTTATEDALRQQERARQITNMDGTANKNVTPLQTPKLTLHFQKMPYRAELQMETDEWLGKWD
ncbi:hypothetical protein CL629_03410 [bacterium]|nr:hypothetical protein [bacterium]|tara:strand:+ start:7000 stop:7224 length:225 start_codon:yes stop_codon:yes gene_type:complete